MHNSCNEPFPEVCDLIKYLKERNVIVALITGKGEKSCYISLRKLGMEDCFSEIMVGDEKRLNKSDSIVKLLKKYCINEDEFFYVGDALSDVVACREVSVTCLSAAWSNSVDLKELKKINPNHIFNDVCSLKIFLEGAI